MHGHARPPALQLGKRPLVPWMMHRHFNTFPVNISVNISRQCWEAQFTADSWGQVLSYHAMVGEGEIYAHGTRLPKAKAAPSAAVNIRREAGVAPGAASRAGEGALVDRTTCVAVNSLFLSLALGPGVD